MLLSEHLTEYSETIVCELTQPLIVNNNVLAIGSRVNVCKGNAASAYCGYSINGERQLHLTDSDINNLLELVEDNDEEWYC